MDIMSKFGDNLDMLMYDKKLSVNQLSQVVNVSESTIRKYLRKEILPTLQNAIVLADYFSCSLDYLLGLAADAHLNYKHALPFSQALQEIMKTHGCSKYCVCKNTSIRFQQLLDWYTGARIPSVLHVAELAKFFNCSIDALLQRE